MDDDTKRALRNIAIFAGIKFAILYGIMKSAERAYSGTHKK